ncbi:hypothetical protein EJ110_NYTH04428 [Nymphaea thermarum]|nr:hypothetical protein EJ110_NYTH04428 [Nymphaea thermarum]
MWKTVEQANQSIRDGRTAFRSSTVAVSGNGFMARDITFQNSADPSKHQAVAFRNGSDQSAHYRCRFAGYSLCAFAQAVLPGMRYLR